jgi:DNA replicative helicase MCM subunit Mcm2 (Cdc46/Mcm family)
MILLHHATLKELNLESCSQKREDELVPLHFLGDPGLGKSQILQAAAAVSPRGIYVCGNATTRAGLTVAVVKDSMTSDYAFEAGSFFSFFFYHLCFTSI